MNRDAVRHHLTGPIASIRTPFCRDGGVDYDGLRAFLDRVIEHGSRTALLTAGDSHYMCLSDAEISEITRVTCQHVAGRAMVVAADRQYDTGRAVQFARQARSMGADVVMVLPPDWGQSCTVSSLVDHYSAVAREAPVMIVTNLLAARGPKFGLEVIDRSLDACADIVAVKDDVCEDFARRLCLLAHDRAALFAGGRKVNHMNMWPYGCDGYMSTYLMFTPEVPRRYWQAVTGLDMVDARSVIGDFDLPFFDFMAQRTGGWNAGLHAALEVWGIAGRWRRPPYQSLDDAEVEEVRQFFVDLGLRP